jgi:hypothetical protein
MPEASDEIDCLEERSRDLVAVEFLSLPGGHER